MKIGEALRVPIGIAVTGVFLLLLILQPAWVRHVDWSVQDALLSLQKPPVPSEDVLIVAIDEASLARYGRWPWPRTLIGRLVTAIQDAGASVVALDMIFPEADRAEVHEQAAIVPGPVRDEALAAVFARSNVVVGVFADFERAAEFRPCPVKPLPIVLREAQGASEPAVSKAPNIVCNIPVLAQAARLSGFLNVAPDSDGVIRRVPLLLESQGTLIPSLALAAYWAHTGAGNVHLAYEADGTAQMRIAESPFVLGPGATMQLRFRGPARTMRYRSALDLLQGAPPDLRGKIVVIGATAAGLRDTIATPVASVYPGIELHATAIDNMLRGDSLAPASSNRFLELLLITLSGVGIVLLLRRTRRLDTLCGVALLAIAALWIVSGLWLAQSGSYLSPVLASLAVLFNAGVLALVNMAAARRESEQSELRLRSARELMVGMLAHLTEIQDAETGAHLLRMQRYTRAISLALAAQPRYQNFLTADTIELLVLLVPIHDIGKVAVPKAILGKPGALTPDEFAEVKRHVDHGRDVLMRARTFSFMVDEALFAIAHDIVYAHHERWDGTGYPLGLAADSIPLPGRIVAIVDVYDALVNKRCYKPQLSHSEAVDIIQRGRGTHFDPDIADAFLRVADVFAVIARESGHPEPPDPIGLSRTAASGL